MKVVQKLACLKLRTEVKKLSFTHWCWAGYQAMVEKGLSSPTSLPQTDEIPVSHIHIETFLSISTYCMPFPQEEALKEPGN